MNVHVLMPSGARSRGYERADKDAMKTFEQVASQLRTWANFTADVVLENEIGETLHIRRIDNA